MEEQTFIHGHALCKAFPSVVQKSILQDLREVYVRINEQRCQIVRQRPQACPLEVNKVIIPDSYKYIARLKIAVDKTRVWVVERLLGQYLKFGFQRMKVNRQGTEIIQKSLYKIS